MNRSYVLCHCRRRRRHQRKWWKNSPEDLNFGTRWNKVFKFLFIGVNFVRVSRQLFLNEWDLSVRSGCGFALRVNKNWWICGALRVSELNAEQCNTMRVQHFRHLFFFFSLLFHALSFLMSRKSGELSKLMYHTNPCSPDRNSFSLRDFFHFFFFFSFFSPFRALPFRHVMGHLFGGGWVWVCWVGILCMLTWFA